MLVLLEERAGAAGTELRALFGLALEFFEDFGAEQGVVDGHERLAVKVTELTHLLFTDDADDAVAAAKHDHLGGADVILGHAKCIGDAGWYETGVLVLGAYPAAGDDHVADVHDLLFLGGEADDAANGVLFGEVGGVGDINHELFVNLCGGVPGARRDCAGLGELVGDDVCSGRFE